MTVAAPADHTPADERWATARPRLLEATVRSFDVASRAAGCPPIRSYRIAGHRVDIRGAGSCVLDRLTRTFGHLRVAGEAPAELVINVWDSASTDAPPPPLPSFDGETAPGAFFYFSDDRIRAGFQVGTSGDPRVTGVYTKDCTPALSLLSLADDEAWYWVQDGERIPYWEEATPIRYLLDWWMRNRGVHQLHAGAVGLPEGGVIIVGKSGSGKSTTTLSTLQSDLRYAGDDYVAVALEPEPYVHSLYSSGKLMPDHVRTLPFLLPALSNARDLELEKAVVYVHEAWPENIATGFPLRAVVVPKIVPGRVAARAVEANRVTGITALAPSTVFQMHTRAQDSLRRMSRLVERVPTFVLELGSDMASIPVEITRLIERLNAEPSR